MTARFSFWPQIAAWGFLLNMVWEFGQCLFLYDMWSWGFWRGAGWMWGGHLRRCTDCARCCCTRAAGGWPGCSGPNELAGLGQSLVDRARGQYWAGVGRPRTRALGVQRVDADGYGAWAHCGPLSDCAGHDAPRTQCGIGTTPEPRTEGFVKRCRRSKAVPNYRPVFSGTLYHAIGSIGSGTFRKGADRFTLTPRL